MYNDILNQTKALYPNINIEVEGLVIKSDFVTSDNRKICFDHICQNLESLIKEIPFKGMMIFNMKNDDFKNKIPS